MTPQQDSEKRFSLYYRDGYAVLEVPPSENFDQKVYAEDILNRMKILGIPLVRMMKLEEIIERADGKAEILVEWPAGGHLAPAIQIRVNEDKMSAEALVEPPRTGGGRVTVDQFNSALDRHELRFGIKRDVISDCIDREIYNEWILVAEGRQPVHGRGGKIRYLFNTDRGKPFRELPFGRIDLKELNFIDYKEKDCELAVLEPAVDPQDGKDLYDNIVEAKPAGDGETLNAGTGCEVRENKIFAIDSGNVRLDRGVVVVEPVVTVNNVDYETGNLSFDGSVIVKGHVADGFEIRATGDIQIGKSVGRVSIIAGRNLILQSGINGDREGHLETGADLYARFIESSFVDSKGSAFVSGALLNSTVKIGGDLLLEGGRCEIVGGLTVVKGWVKCRKIGSLYEAKTSVVVGVMPERLDAFYDLLKELSQLRTQQDNLDKQLNHFEKLCNQKDATGLTCRQRDQAAESVKEAEYKAAEKLKEVHHMRRELEPDNESFVLAEDMIYLGSKVSFGLTDYAPQQRGASKTILQCRDGKIKETGYNPAQIPEEIRKALPSGD